MGTIFRTFRRVDYLGILYTILYYLSTLSSVHSNPIVRNSITILFIIAENFSETSLPMNPL